jgi:glycerol-3-phosphate cytidylyltransferase
MSVVYTGGTFDLFHSGHVNLLQRCKNIAGADGTVIVSLNTDEFIFSYKGNTPVCTYEERKAVLEACQYVDVVVPNVGGADSKISIQLSQAEYVVIGSDWARKDYYKQMDFDQDWLDARGIGLIYIPYTQEVSSTKIKNRIKN